MIRITRDHIDVREVLGSVADVEAGGICSFIGTTRRSGNDRPVLELEYVCYDLMARREMERIEDTVRNRWPIRNIAIVHRVGVVPLGEAGVVVAVSSGHRQEAFEACRFAIDELKSIVPIWKKERYADGEEWVGQPGRGT